MKTEKEMRLEKVPTFATIDELSKYISELVERNHDYGTCVYAISLAATAAFNLVAAELGVTGFQASMADLDVLRRTRGMKGPFVLLKGEDELYPQYDNIQRYRDSKAGWHKWIADEAARKIASHTANSVHPDVWAHWQKLASEAADVLSSTTERDTKSQ